MTRTMHIALAALLAAAPVVAMAQSKATPPAAATRAGELDTRIAELHARLHITPAQEALWADCTKVMRDNATQMGELYRAANPATLSAPDALDHYARIAQAHADEIKNLVVPFQALYGNMDATQKKVADEAFRSFERRRGRGA